MTEIARFFCLNRKYLIYNLVKRNLKVRYRRSFFGFFWTLIVPASMTLVYLFMFRFIARINEPNYPFLILSCIIPWTFVSTTLLTGTDSLVNNFGILSKVPIATAAFPLSDAYSSFINLLLSLPILILSGLFFHIYPNWSWVLAPLLLAALFIQVYCLALVLSVANVFLRDVRHMVSIFVQIWMYLTPIVYTSEMIPEDKRWYFYFNPLFGIFDAIQSILYRGQWPSMVIVGHICLWTLMVFILAFFVNYRFRYKVVEKL